jgi:hypothetical protein
VMAIPQAAAALSALAVAPKWRLAVMPTDAVANALGCDQGQIPWQSGEGAMRTTTGIVSGESGKRETSTRRHHKASSAVRAQRHQLMGQCWGRTHVPMALFRPRRPPPCHRDGNEQAMQTDTRLAHVRAPGNTNVAAQRAVAISSTVVAEGTIGSLGARYV